MEVIKRNGSREAVDFNKILNRIEVQAVGLDSGVIDCAVIAKSVVNGLYDGVRTTELDKLAAETAASMATLGEDYLFLAGRLVVSSIYKVTVSTFGECISLLYNNKGINGVHAPLVSEELLMIYDKHSKEIEKAINHDNDLLFDYFGIKTLENTYLLKDSNNNTIERPQYLYMRVAIGIHGDNIDSILTTYKSLSERYYTYATPTLFNAGTLKPQMSSCFLMDMYDDSINGIYENISDCAKISKYAGGIGVAIHKIRAKGSYIKGTGGISNGIIPMLKVFDATAKYVDQGGGKRKGSFAIYLEVWHRDIYDFLDLKKNHGKEELRARDLFYGLWVCDLFMQRVRDNGDWSLFCPSVAIGLDECYGEKFNELYISYENDTRLERETIKARELWDRILTSQIETGNPYLLYKDACNEKSNQKNLGIIKSSNLCTEIIEYTDKDEVAVCNLASISLPKYIDYKDGKPTGFNFGVLDKKVRELVHGLNGVIDRNYYPIEKAKYSNERHRPIGLGVQGLADVFAILKIGFDSKEAHELNERIFEQIYYSSVCESCNIAKVKGAYKTFNGSPLSEGKFQFNLWGIEDSTNYDWEELRKRVKKYGVSNSLLLAPMPTASTSQILGNNECFEPYTSNIYTRRTLSGEFIVVNKYLLKELRELGIWSNALREKMISSNGSVMNIDEIPFEVRQRYKTAYELSQRVLIDMAASRGKYICQSQSLNLFVENASIAKLSSMHFYSWGLGLKTGIYYLRTKAATDAIKFTLSEEYQKKYINEANKDKNNPQQIIGMTCSMEDGCLSCGS